MGTLSTQGFPQSYCEAIAGSGFKRLKYFENEHVTLLLASQHIDSDDIDIYVKRRVPFADSFSQNRIWLFLLIWLLEMAAILVIRLRIDAKKKRSLDITERKKNEQTLLDMVRRLQLKDFALNAELNAVVITDVHGRVEWANSAFTQLSGYSLVEIQGQVLGELVKSGLQTKEFYEQFWQSIIKRESWHGELLNRRKNRSLYWEEMSISPVNTIDDHGQHWVVVNQDISQRKAMERDLHVAQENMQRLPDSMAEGVFEIDVLGKIIFVVLQ